MLGIIIDFKGKSPDISVVRKCLDTMFLEDYTFLISDILVIADGGDDENISTIRTKSNEGLFFTRDDVSGLVRQLGDYNKRLSEPQKITFHVFGHAGGGGAVSNTCPITQGHFNCAHKWVSGLATHGGC